MKNRTLFFCIFFILTGAITLTDTRSLYGPYLLAAVFGIFCLLKIKNIDCPRKTRGYRLVLAASLISAIFITLANYDIWQHPELPEDCTVLFSRLVKLMLIFFIMAGTFTCTLCILVYTIFVEKAFTVLTVQVDRRRLTLSFLIPFCLISLIYLTVYFSSYFPGLMSLDSIDQVRQIYTGTYSNHQPFYHTMILGAFIRAGLMIFGDINRAVMLYVVFQILFMAASFAYVTYNIASLGMPRWMIRLAAAWYALMPFHIMFSFTVWKDVFFGAFVTILIILLIRIERDMAGFWTYVAFALFSVLICLIRSNGLFAYVFVFAGVVLLMRKHRSLLVMMPLVIVLSFVLKHNVLSSLNVVQPDTVESLSIPLQQISRVIAEGGYMTPEDEAFLSNIIDVSSIKDIYDPDISDPIKNAIRDFGNEEYLTKNMGSFAQVYLRTVIHNPSLCVFAWVDSTCGYWNSGYNYWVWFWDVEENDLGISRTVFSPGVLRFMDRYLWLFYNVRAFQLFTAIGMFVWIVLVLFVRSIAKKNRAGIIAAVPILATLLSLLVSSPVYAEFRYMYPLFTALPILFAITFKGGTARLTKAAAADPVENEVDTPEEDN